ncbi:PQQ-binding-like beta-propeller repeat protein [Natrinema sp. J7-2]|uniref:outer membrane protein assembly factor BamB family protein n=1 Tax=Natrinema sp. (strain J7-2) TaxID=406552 RepID=UPI000A02AECE|nr:PQQ-binding-like beta-propeller repeat protein [Natrinema sp. J7-2]
MACRNRRAGSEPAGSPRDRVVFGSTDGRCYAVDRRNGDERWRYETDGGIASSPTVRDGTVYFRNWRLRVHAVDVETGERRWRTTLRGRVNGSPTLADGVLYVGDAAGIVHALDPETGEAHWRFETDNAVIAAPTVVDVAYVASNDGRVYALDVT